MLGTACWRVFAAALVVGTLFVPSADARTLQEILASKKIRLGTVPYPPMTQIDSKTGAMTGIWVDGPRFIFQQLGLEVEFVETKWATFASGLQSNQFDVFVGGSFATPKRSVAISRRLSRLTNRFAIGCSGTWRYRPGCRRPPPLPPRHFLHQQW